MYQNTALYTFIKRSNRELASASYVCMRMKVKAIVLSSNKVLWTRTRCQTGSNNLLWATQLNIVSFVIFLLFVYHAGFHLSKPISREKTATTDDGRRTTNDERILTIHLDVLFDFKPYPETDM